MLAHYLEWIQRSLSDCKAIVSKGRGFRGHLDTPPLAALDELGCYFVSRVGIRGTSKLKHQQRSLSDCKAIVPKGRGFRGHLDTPPSAALDELGCYFGSRVGIRGTSKSKHQQRSLSDCKAIVPKGRGLRHSR